MAQIFDAEHRRRKSSLVFPNEPNTDRGQYLRFIEKSGAADVLHEVFGALYAARDQPEDPIHWMRNYFRLKAPRRTEELNNIIESLKDEIIAVETELHNSNVFKEMEEEKKEVRPGVWYPKKYAYKYQADEYFAENGGDPRWQIKPDPLYRPTPTSGTIVKPTSPSWPPELEREEECWLNELITPPEADNEGRTDFKFPDLPQGLNRRHGSLLSGEGKSMVSGSPPPPTVEMVQFALKHEMGGIGDKSTETSPQGSSERIPGVGGKPERKSKGPAQSHQAPTPPDPPIPIPTIEDEEYLARRIPPGFWKYDFDLASYQSQDEDENEPEADEVKTEGQLKAGKEFLQSRNYKAVTKEENGWLPGRDVPYHLGRNRSFYRLDKSIMPNALPPTEASPKEERPKTKKEYKATKQLKAFLTSPDQPVWEPKEAKPDQPLVSYEWSQKKHGVAALRRRSTQKDPSADMLANAKEAVFNAFRF